MNDNDDPQEIKETTTKIPIKIILPEGMGLKVTDKENNTIEMEITENKDASISICDEKGCFRCSEYLYSREITVTVVQTFD